MLLKIKNLHKKYKNRTILKDVSLELSSGEIVGLLGPNGAGKTTCFYMIIGLVACDSGDIYLNNQCLSSLPIHARARSGLGYLPQEPSVFRNLSVRDNILAILELLDLSKEEQDLRLNQLLSEFQLVPIQDSLGLSLSGGERRRVEIARALASEPRFILLDEPFAGVDPLSILEIKQQILALSKRGIGVLITDHNVRETLEICQRAYIFNAGGILASGSPQELLENKAVRDIYLGERFNL
jgi:lipopolysaccharide export system ATP-binding protein